MARGIKNINVLAERAVETTIRRVNLSLKARIRKVIFAIMNGQAFEAALYQYDVAERAFWLLLGKDRKAAEWLEAALRARYTKAAIRLTDIADDFREGRLDDRSALVESKLLANLMPLMKQKLAASRSDEGSDDNWEDLTPEDRIALFAKPVNMLEDEKAKGEVIALDTGATEPENT